MLMSYLASSVTGKGSSLTPPTDPWSLIQYGILGVIVTCLVTRKGIVPEWVLKQSEDRHARELSAMDERHTRELKASQDENAGLRDQVGRLQAVTMEQMIPALTRATEVAAKYNENQAHQRWSAGER